MKRAVVVAVVVVALLVVGALKCKPRRDRGETMPPPSEPRTADVGAAGRAKAPASTSAAGAASIPDGELVTACKQLVRKALKNPYDASFPAVESGDYVVTREDPRRYRVGGWVESKDALNARRREQWVCTIEDAGRGNMKEKYLRIGERTVVEEK
jgi:hypothetical protein